MALGNTALRRLIPEADGIVRHRGFVLDDAQGRLVVPTYHPNFLLPREGQANTSRFVGVVIRDLRKAVRIARDGFVRRRTLYLEDPHPQEFQTWITSFEHAYKEGEVKYLAFDIETPYKLKNQNEDDITDSEDEDKDEGELPTAEPILRISFAYREGEAVTVPWCGPYLEQIKFLLAHPVSKATWNGVRFDVPVIQSHGVHVGGRIYDFMWGFHVWQSDLPKSLEFASSLLTDLKPWKHRSSSEPALYNAIDSDAQLRCGLSIEAELKAVGQWEIFERHVTTLDPLLIAMGKRGALIDITAQDLLRTELQYEQATLTAQAQVFIPRELFPRKTFKTQPESVDGDYAAVLSAGDCPEPRQLDGFDVVYETGVVKVCTHCGQIVSNKTEHLKGKKNPCRGAKATLSKQSGFVPRFDELEPFNPNSVQNLISYAKHFKHPVPQSHKTGRDTLDKKAVEKLAKAKGKDHPLYKIALTIRGVKKTLGTYVEGFRPDSEGLIHTTFGHHPSSLRLSARNVNTTNISHRGGVAYAERVRRTIIPRPGHVFVEADSAAIEAVFTGYFMGSAEYIALAKKGIHDYLNCFENEIPFDDEGIKRSKSEFNVSRDRNKIVVHGTSYGMTPYLMHMSWPDIFPKVQDADRAQQRFFAACPGLKEWQHEVRTFAHKNSYLENPWKYRHYFYDVFTKKDGMLHLGSDGNRCVSFLPQSSAAAFLKDNILLLSETPFWPLPAIGVIHDAYILEVPVEEVPYAIETLTEILTRPIPEMQNLSVGCAIKLYRSNWQDSEAA